MSSKSSGKSGPGISKHDILLKLLRSNNGASIAQMQDATGWQPHSVRGFLVGTVKKKEGLALSSKMSKSGQRRYFIEAR
jgi:hypothetical protein